MAFLDLMPPIGSQADLSGLIIFQADHFDALATVLVIPCRAPETSPDLGKLTPVLSVNGTRHRAFLSEMAAVPRSILKGPPLGTARDHRDRLVAALDLLVLGW